MTWSLITAPDERERCCVVIDDARCERPTKWRVAGAGGELDDVTYTCPELVRQPDDRVEPVG